MTAQALFNWLDHRAAGILLHPTSLPGNQGIGVLDRHSTDWLDFLEQSRIRYWQVCPLGPTGYGDSPYQCFSAFAGNPYLIDLAALIPHGLLQESDLSPLSALPQDKVDYGELYQRKWPVLFKAFEHFRKLKRPDLPYGDFEVFQQKQRQWLEPYALFMALKDEQKGQAWLEWPEELRFYERACKVKHSKATQLRAQAYAFCQYLFFGQWQQLRQEAKDRGIEIIGDAPIFVASDSADVWARPDLFQINPKNGQALCVAGVPPDYFSEDGQLWGNPLYAWDAHAKEGYAWWLERLRANFELCDVLRIDHFRAFDTYWSIPAGAKNAKKGEWLQGPGLAFFQKIRETLPNARLIAEDLGDLLPSVHTLREGTGLPGMAILQFAFGGDAGNSYLPHNHQANCVVYPGTHDNDTTRGWYQHAPEGVRDHVRRYLRISGEDIAWDFIRTTFASVCKLAILPLPDLLALDSRARFNSPGIASGNWQWRCQTEQMQILQQNTSAALRDLGDLYARAPGKKPTPKTAITQADQSAERTTDSSAAGKS